MDVTKLSDQEISDHQTALSAEANKRLRAVYIPQQITESCGMHAQAKNCPTPRYATCSRQR